MGSNGLLQGRVQGPYSPSICYLVFTGLSRRISVKVWDRYNPRWHDKHSGQTLKKCENIRFIEPGVVSIMYGRQGDCIRLRCLPVKTPPSFGCFLPQPLPPKQVAELKWDCFYGRLKKCLKAMVAFLKASPQEKIYSDYLKAAREVEKEDSMDPS